MQRVGNNKNVGKVYKRIIHRNGQQRYMKKCYT